MQNVCCRCTRNVKFSGPVQLSGRQKNKYLQINKAVSKGEKPFHSLFFFYGMEMWKSILIISNKSEDAGIFLYYLPGWY